MSDDFDRVQEQARKWIDSAVDRWRLQILSRRVRVRKVKNPDTGVIETRTEEVPSRLRRFVEGIPWAFVKPAMDYLLSQIPYTGVIVNGVDFGVAYRPTITVWQRDQQSIALGARAADATYTLIQDLVEDTERDVYAVGQSDSCSEEVVADYVWDSGDVESLPSAAQGETYSIVGVRRNEDGTFDYQLVKRTAKTHVFGWAVVRDDALTRVEEKLFDNVYTTTVEEADGSRVRVPGVDGTFYDHEGAVLDVPVPHAVAGVSVRIDGLREAPDCTLSFTAVREMSKRAVVREDSTENQYQEDRGRMVHETIKLPEAPDAHDGLITTHDTQLQADGSYQNTVQTKQEQAVKDSVVEVRVGRKGRRVTRKDRNQPAPVSVSDVGVGGAVTVEKTPGRLYDNTTSVFDVGSPVRAGDKCHEDLFRHIDAETTGGAQMPSPDDHVVGGVDGLVVTRDVDMDDDGAVTQTLTVDRERPVEAAREAWRVSLNGVEHSVTDRHQDAPAEAPEFARANIGRTVENQRTPGGLYDVTRAEQLHAPALTTADGCQKTVFQEVDETTRTDPGADVDPVADHVVDAGGGHVRSSSRQLTNEGSVVVRNTLTTEIRQADAEVVYTKTPRGMIIRRTVKNDVVPASRPSGMGVESHSLTPGGRYDHMVQTAIPSATPDSSRCAATVYEHVHDTPVFGTALTGAEAEAGGGQHEVVEENMDDMGVVKTVHRVTTEKLVNNAQVTQSVDHFTVARVVETANDPGNPPVLASPLPGDDRSVLAMGTNARVTQGGVTTWSETLEQPYKRSWTEEVNSKFMVGTRFYFRNFTKAEKDELRNQAQEYFNEELVEGYGMVQLDPEAPARASFSPEVNLNKYGLYDGVFSAFVTWPEDSGGQGTNTALDYLEQARWAYWDVNVDTKPIYDRNGRMVGFNKHVMQKHVTEIVGRGWQAACDRYVQEHHLLSGSGMSFNPSTGAFHIKLIDRADVYEEKFLNGNTVGGLHHYTVDPDGEVSL